MRRVYNSVLKPYISWQGALAALGIAVLVFIYTFKLGTLVPGMSPMEIESIGQSSSVSEIIDNPLYAPHKIATLVLFKLNIYSPEALRSISAFFTVVVCIIFYQLLKKWHSRRTAALATILFAASSWLLAVGRHASPTALLLIWFVLVASLFWFKHFARRKYLAYALLILFAASLYIPSSFYIFVIFGILYGKKIIHFLTKLGPKHMVGLGAVALVAAGPLLFAFFKTPGLIQDWLLIPDNLTVGTVVRNFINLPKALLYSAPYNPEFWLSRLPLLDLFSGTMLLLGLYAYRYYLRLKRTPLVWACVVVATLLTGLAGMNAAIILLPFLYIIIANGISYLLGDWLSVFPKNPLARGLGTALVLIAVIAAAGYQTSRYFIAWPKASATRELYSIKQ